MAPLTQEQPEIATAAATTKAPWGKAEWRAAALLTAGVLLSFSPVVHCDFINHDDPVFVTENPQVRLGLSWQGVRWALSGAYFDMLAVADNVAVAHWQPLVWLTYLLDYQLYGFRPAGYHVTNLLWHLGSTLLLFAALRRMTGATWRSFVVAALFGVHPLNVQAVAWVAERKGVVSTFFWMLTLWAYARYVERPNWTRYVLVAAALAVGMQAKQMLVTLPCVLLLLDLWPLRRCPAARDWTWAILEKAPLLVIGFAFALIVLLQRPGADTAPVALPLAARLANAVISYAAYLRQFVLPVDLAVYYPLNSSEVPIGRAAAAALLLIGISVLALAQRQRRPYLAVGWLWFVGTLLPVSGIVQLGGYARADRYVYVPMVGLCIIVAWCAAELARYWRGVTPLLGVGLLSLAAITWLQVHFWYNSVVLWANTVDATGPNPVALCCLADALKRIEPDIAEKRLHEAIAIAPDYPPAHAALGLLLKERGDWEGASRHFESALRTNPRFAGVHYNLAQCLLQQDRIDRAIHHFNEALRLTPARDAASTANRAAIHGSLGWCWMKRGDFDEAIASFHTASKLDSSDRRFAEAEAAARTAKAQARRAR